MLPGVSQFRPDEIGSQIDPEPFLDSKIESDLDAGEARISVLELEHRETLLYLSCGRPEDKVPNTRVKKADFTPDPLPARAQREIDSITKLALQVRVSNFEGQVSHVRPIVVEFFQRRGPVSESIVGREDGIRTQFGQ